MKSYELKIGQSEGSLISGSIEVEIPKYFERLDMMKALQMKVVDGEVVGGEDAMLSVKKAYEIVEKYAKAFKLKTVKGEDIESLEALSYFQEGAAVIMEAAGAIVGGIRLGNG